MIKIPKTDTELQVGYMERIKIAATINSVYIVPQLCQLIGYRQRIAQMIQQRGDHPESVETLNAALDYVNNQIKQLLGV